MGDLGVRTVDVLPPSASGEGRLVFQAMGAIVFGALLIVGLHTDDRAPPADLAPFQMLFRDAVPSVQRMFREMQEGLTEAETMRAASKQWPSVTTLAAQGIPPFARPSPGYGWRLFHEGLYVGYVGAPSTGSAAASSASDTPAFLALIQEPAPGYTENPPPGAPPDETHHRLGDGTLLHVTLWFRSDGAVPDGDSGLIQPFAAGWTQVLVGAQRP